MTQTATKIVFDAAGANRVLPLLRSIAHSLVEDRGRLRMVCHNKRVLETTTTSETRSSAMQGVIDGLQQEENDLRTAIDGYIMEFTRLHVTVCDLDRGGVHFPAITSDDIDMVLCWNPGEPAVSHWHEPADACTARRAFSSH